MDCCRCILLLLFLFRSGTDVCQARNKTADSLLVLLKNDRTDSNKVHHLNQLSAEFNKARNFDSASYYGNAALQLAGRLNFKRGMAVACIRIGAVYEGMEKLNEALEKYLASLKLFEEIEDKSGISDSYYNIGSIDWKTGSYDLALKNLSISLKLKENIGDKKGIASAYNIIGVIYFRQGRYDKALENYFNSLKIREEIGDKAGVSGSYNNIANVYLSQGDYNHALEKYLESLKLKQEIGDKQQISVAYYNIAETYYMLGKYGVALKNDLESLKLKEEIGDKQGIAASYNHIGNIYLKQRNFDKALESQFKSLKLFEEIGAKFSMANTAIGIGNAYLGKLNFKDAEIWFQKAVKQGKEIGSMPVLLDAYQALSETNAKTNNYRSAFEYYQLYSQVKDSIFSQKSSKQINEISAGYENEKKEKEIELLKKTQALKDLQVKNQLSEISKQKLYIIFSIVAILLAILSLGLLANRYYLKKKSGEELLKTYNLLSETNRQITDSIQYAQRLQHAMLPREEEITKFLPDSFIFFRPKDIVSGDFYWFSRLGSKNIVVVADCTGHGVPGALMSMVGNTLLNQVVNEQRVEDPGEILAQLNKSFYRTFSLNRGGDEADGMDMSVCSIISDSGTVSFAGANQSLFLVTGAKTEIIAGDIHSIGGIFSNPDATFTTQSMALQAGSSIYLSTDGFFDQIGSESNKKYQALKLAEFVRTISRRKSDEKKEMLAREFDAWKGSRKQNDDVLVWNITI